MSEADLQRQIDELKARLNSLAGLGAPTLGEAASDNDILIGSQFISPASTAVSAIPTETAFSGVAMGGTGWVFNGETWHFVGVDNGVLQVGINTDGKLSAGQGDITLDSDGITIQNNDQHALVINADTNTGSTATGGITTTSSNLVLFQASNPTSDYVANGTFASGDLTSWTDGSVSNGSASVVTVDGGYALRLYSGTSAGKEGKVTQAISPSLSAGSLVVMTFRARIGDVVPTREAELQIEGFPDDILIENDGLWRNYVAISKYATSLTIGFTAPYDYDDFSVYIDDVVVYAAYGAALRLNTASRYIGSYFDFQSNVRPVTDGIYDIGASGLGFSSLYANKVYTKEQAAPSTPASGYGALYHTTLSRPAVITDKALVGDIPISPVATVNAAQTSGTGETVLATYTIPAAVLENNGQGVRITAKVDTTTGASTKTYRVRFGGASGTILASQTATGAARGVAQCWVWRTGAATQEAFGYWVDTVSGGSGITSSSPTQTLANAVDIVLTGQTTNASHTVKNPMLMVEFLPMANQ